MPHNEARELLVVGYEATRDMPCIREAQPGVRFLGYLKNVLMPTGIDWIFEKCYSINQEAA